MIETNVLFFVDAASRYQNRPTENRRFNTGIFESIGTILGQRFG